MAINNMHEDMLATISDDYQKSPGFPTYDFTAAFAVCAEELKTDIAAAENNFDAANLEGDALESFVFQHRGMSRKEGIRATATLTLVTGSGTVTAGDLFSTEDGLKFAATETAELEAGDEFEVEAVESGTKYNVISETITYIPITIPGIGTVTNYAAASNGTDNESDEALLERYLDDLRYPANGSNANAYIRWATSVDGVGRAKCFPLEGGQNKVKVTITSDEMTVPSSSVVSAVQSYLDPNANGDGSGVAPIGAVVTVAAATAKTINVSATITLATGASLAAVKTAVTAAITDYFADIAYARNSGIYETTVSISKVGSLILNVAGVSDYSNLKLNNASSHITLTDKEIPIIGTVTLS